MLVRTYVPNADNLSVRELFKAVSSVAPIGGCFKEIGAYYSKHVPMWQVLDYLGQPVGQHTEQEQIHCVFSTHGSEDRHKSARYYGFSREGDETESSVYCFRCNDRKTSLRLLEDYRKSRYGEDFIATLEWIEQTFKVPFPSHIILDKDIDELANLDPEGEPRQEALHRLMGDAVEWRKVRENGITDENRQSYLDALVNLLNTRV